MLGKRRIIIIVLFGVLLVDTSLTWSAATGGIGDVTAETGSTGIDTIEIPRSGIGGTGSSGSVGSGTGSIQSRR